MRSELRVTGIQNPRFRPLNPEHIRQLLSGPHPRHVLGVAAQQDVRTAPRHVGGDGHCATAPALRHNLRLALHILRLGVQQLVRDACGAAGNLMGTQRPALHER